MSHVGRFNVRLLFLCRQLIVCDHRLERGDRASASRHYFSIVVASSIGGFFLLSEKLVVMSPATQKVAAPSLTPTESYAQENPTPG